MTDSRICPDCGIKIPADSPKGLCPKCLIGLVGHPATEEGLSPVLEGSGSVIGHYRLLQQIGEGGMGVVYMAEQIEPVRRMVALKIIKLGMDTKEVVARFEAERQVLAMMDHPNIAKVFDGGSTESGRPYFVMELISGQPITEYCDANCLRPLERIDLFRKVCHAVQHAHQKGIIHRDLKPSNVLIAAIDGKPVPKVIDFGVAKALGRPLTEKTLFTDFEMIIGTPSYMSPEQTARSGVDVDTRSDIYSLGALLYELLTGVTPIDTHTLREAALDEVHRMIREAEPPKPSTRLRALGEKLNEVAQHRHSDPSALPRLLHGDLDWIIMKALEKDRKRRYETAAALAEDLQRQLDHRPVLAGPPGPVYRARKFAWRHRVGVGLSATVLAALLLGLSAAVAGLMQARKERDRAVTAERQIERERNHAELLAAEAALERGQAKLEAGDSWGLLDLVDAYEVAEHNLAFQEYIGRRWSTWHAEWDRRTIAVRPLRCAPAAPAPCHGSPSPDFRLYATVDIWPPHNTSRDVMVFDTLSGARVTGPLAHDAVVKGCAFSPDGHLLATVTERGVIHLWDSRTGQPIRPSCETGIPELNGLTFSAGGRHLVAYSREHAGPQSTEALLLHLDEPQGPPHVLPHRYPVGGARFSPDADLLAISCKPDLQLWRTGDHQPARSPIAVTTSHVVDFSGNGSQLAFDPAGSGGVGVLDTATLQVLEVLQKADSRANSVGLSHDGALLATFDWACNLELWHVGSPRESFARLKTMSRMGGYFAFNPDDSLVAMGERSGIVHVLRTRNGHPVGTLHTPPMPLPVFLPNGVLAADADGVVYFWDLVAPPLPGSALPHDALAYSLAFDPSGTYLAVGSEGELRLWTMQPTPRLERVVPLPGRVGTLIYSSKDGCFVAFSDDGSLTTVEPVSGVAVAKANLGRGRDLSACLSPDARKLALYRYFEAFLVDTRTGGSEWFDNLAGTESVAFRPDSGRLAVGSANWHVYAYDTHAETSVLVGESQKMGGQIEGLAYHPNGHVLAVSVGSRAIRLYETESGRQLFNEYEPLLRRIDLLGFSTDGRLLATAGPGREGGYGIELWHMDSEHGLHRTGTPLPCDQPVWSLAFSPDNRILVAGGMGSTRLWHMPPARVNLQDVQSRTWATLGFRFDGQGEMVFLDPTTPDGVKIRTRLTGEASPRATPLETILGRPPDEAVQALQPLLDRHPESKIYRGLLGRLHAKLVISQARKELWTSARVHADEAFHLGYDDPRTSHFRALLCLELGDPDGYRSACEDMVRQYGASEDPAVVRWIAWTAALAPDAVGDTSELVVKLRDAVERVGGQDAEGYRFYLGALLARSGRYAEAVTELDRLAVHLTAGTYVAFPPVYNLYLLAMCHAHLGNATEARRDFEAALADHQSLLQTTQGVAAAGGAISWDRRLVLEWLRREAEETLRRLTPQADAS